MVGPTVLEEVDATLLLMPIYDFLPPSDPRVQATTERVVKEGKSYVKNIIEGIIAKQALPGAAGQPQGRYRV